MLNCIIRCPLILRCNVVLCLLVAMAASGAGQTGVILRGHYKYVVRPDEPTPAYSAEANFEVSITGCSWIIAYEDPAAATNANILNERAIASCDGTNIFFVQFQNEKAIKRVWGDRYDSMRKQLPDAMGKIFAGTYPPPEESTLQKIWFAFASTCVLADSKGKIKPPFSTDLAVFYNEKNFSSDYFWTTNHNPPDRQIWLMNDGHALHRNASDGKLLSLKEAPPYDKGYTNAVGTWRQETNIAGVSVPMEFEYVELFPKLKGKSSADLVKTCTYRCIITNIQTAMIGPIPPQLTAGSVMVTDRRFANEGWSKEDYITTNGWPPADQALANLTYQHHRKRTFEGEVLDALGIAPVKPSPWPKYTIWLLLVLPLALVASKGLFDKLKTKRKA